MYGMLKADPMELNRTHRPGLALTCALLAPRAGRFPLSKTGDHGQPS
jgi:hypothetical protein